MSKESLLKKEFKQSDVERVRTFLQKLSYQSAIKR